MYRLPIQFRGNGKKAGFSLVELMVTVVFISIIILGMMRLQTGSIKIADTQNQYFQAHFLANQGLEILEAIGYSGISCSSPCKIQKTAGNYSIISEGGTPEPISGTLFERSIELDDTDLTDAYLATVSVSWEDTAGIHSAKAKRIIY